MLKWLHLKGKSREYHLQELIASLVTWIASRFFWKCYACLELNSSIFFCETREGLSLVLPVQVICCKEHLVSALSHTPCL